MKKLSIVDIDIAKQVFPLVGMDEQGTILVRKRLYRAQVMAFIAQLPPTRIGMEACGGAHDWARRFREHGHEVKLMAPQFVKPYVKANKNDMRDAEAIAEAVTRPTRRFVPTKEVAQQDIQALHRVRERLMGERTALVNTVHGLLHEDGMVRAERGDEVPAHGGREARVRAGQTHPPEPGDVLGVSHLLHTKQPSHLRAFLDKLGNVKGEVLDRLIDLNVVLPGGGRPDAVVAFLKPSQQPHP